MLYLLDANALIGAKNNYYQFERVPEFWAWLRHHDENGNLKLPQEIYDEVAVGKDELAAWIKDSPCKQAFLIAESLSRRLVQHVLDKGYGLNLSEVELEKIGRDPFLIAYALGNSSRCIVTSERSKPSTKRRNRRIPDVCNDLGIQCISDVELLSRLSFSTSWQSQL